MNRTPFYKKIHFLIAASCILFFCAFPLVATAQSASSLSVAKERVSNDSIRVSLLTCSPGNKLYILFGHSAIHFENVTQSLNLVFNYGVFNFQAPHFLWRFVKGETDYRLGINRMDRFVAAYRGLQSDIVEQELDLTAAEKAEIWQLLQINYLPENRVYRYSFLYDNCATRIRDKFEEILSSKLVYNFNKKTYTFRDILHKYTAKNPWAQFGVDLCLGPEADRPITKRQELFIPDFLADALSHATIRTENGEKPLLIKEVKIVDVVGHNWHSWLDVVTPLLVALLLLSGTLFFTVLGFLKRKRFVWLDVFLFGLAGITGCVITFLVLFSVHPAVSPNYLVLFLHPLHLLYLPFLFTSSCPKIRKGYSLLNIVVLTLFMLLFILSIQCFDLAIVPLALCLWIRAVFHLLMYKKG
ncbi:MAG: DUF4105 domain-containing protein [Bacteroidaceae bacterium]|nr:DUF4105 domain-containing protein [Bacteroidaceae bacterium]